MREIGFPVPKSKRRRIIEEISNLYQHEFDFFEEKDLLRVKGESYRLKERRKAGLKFPPPNKKEDKV